MVDGDATPSGVAFALRWPAASTAMVTDTRPALACRVDFGLLCGDDEPMGLGDTDVPRTKTDDL